MGRRDWPRLEADGDPRSLSTLAVEYLGWMEVHGFSSYSVRSRRGLLGRFVAWARDRGLERPTEVTKPILERYQRWLFYLRGENGRALSTRTQAHHLVVLRGWFKWLARENHVLSNPASDLELPKTEKTLPHDVLTTEEVELVMCQPDLETLAGVRDRAMLEVLYSTGLRRMELLNLTIYDVDEQRRTVFIRQGKGKRDRVIPIGGRALGWVRKYLEDTRPQLVVNGGDATLFLSDEGTRLNDSQVSWVMGQYVRRAGLSKKGACHIFRHTMATMMLENGADIRFIQAMLGHALLSTTEVYTRVSIEKLKDVHAATHPGAEERRTSAAASSLAAAVDDATGGEDVTK